MYNSYIYPISLIFNLIFLIVLITNIIKHFRTRSIVTKELWKNFYTSHPEAIFLLNDNLGIIQINNAGQSLIGAQQLKSSETISLLKFIRPQGGVSTTDLPFLLQSRLRGEVRLQFDLDLINSKGRPVPHSLIFTRYYGHYKKSKSYFLCEAVNMEARKKAELVLRESEERFRIFANHFPGILYQWDRINDQSYYYGRVESLTGHSVHDFQGNIIDWTDIIHPEDVEIYKQNYEESLNQIGQENNIEYRIVHTRGDVFWLKELRQVLGTEKVEFIQGIVYDITTIKTRELNLIQSQKLEALGRLTSGIAHDFNNNLMIISALSEYLGSRVSDELKGTVVNIQEGIDAAADLTNRLLVFARGQKDEKINRDLNQLLKMVYPILNRLSGDSIEMNLSLIDKPLVVNISQNQLEQSLINLVINAKDAIQEKGCILIQTDTVESLPSNIHDTPKIKEGPYGVIYIADNGSGMDNKTLSNIFEPFYTTKKAGNGTGLGLSLVYGFMEELGGCIKVESELGKGTTFSLYFPCIKNQVFST
ncbi:PAS domain-containing sensor histidine kinase [Spirochaeta cellobiosiphila]|uniref:PAS domain-containing sensor histidine kinase n=1 Tax=Spirochaeta cellobiosiphila TaxID=504483 RepID=UPI0003F9A8BE|nr:hybrid sensor histidine kinase/response regulator [Spirochaeta cellobiosiphila]